MVLATGGAALEVGAHAGDELVGLGAVELEGDVLVELLDTPVAELLGLGRADQPLQYLVTHVLVHGQSLSRSSSEKPRSDRSARSFRLAS